MDVQALTHATLRRLATTAALLGLLLGGCASTHSEDLSAATPTTRATATSSPTSSPSPALTVCPDLVLQWASTVFVKPRLQKVLFVPSSSADSLACVTEWADYQRLTGRGAAELDFNRPDPSVMTYPTPPTEWLRNSAKAMLDLDCGKATPARKTVGQVTELSCTTHEATFFQAAYAVSNDHAAASAVLEFTGTKTPPDAAAQAYLTEQARSAAYSALGIL